MRIIRRLSVLMLPLLAVLLSASSAQAVPAAGGAQATNLNVPVVSSASVLSATDNTMAVCFTQAVATVAHPDYFQVAGYDANRVASAVSSTGVQAGHPDCVVLAFKNGSDDPKITEFTRATVLSGAVTTASGAANVGGGLALEGTADAPSPGHIAGPDLTGTPTLSTAGGGDTLITFTFSRGLDDGTESLPSGVTGPTVSLNDHFGYYADDGTSVSCGASAAPGSPGVSLSGNTVVCQVPAATAAAHPPVRYWVQPSAVRDRPTNNACCDINVLNTSGATISGRPQIVSATQTGPTQATVTYDQPVTVRDANQFKAVTVYGGTASPSAAVVDGGNPKQVDLTFSNAENNLAYLVVGIADLGSIGPGGGAVAGTGAGTPQSAASYAGVRRAPIQAGYVDAPDLHAVSVDTTTDVGTFTFLGLVAAAPNASSFRLTDVNGTDAPASSVLGISNDISTSTSTVRVQFTAAAVAAARAAKILDGAVKDFSGTSGWRNTVAITFTASPKPSGSGSTSSSRNCGVSGKPKCATRLFRPFVSARQRGGTFRIGVGGLVRRGSADISLPCSGKVRITITESGRKRAVVNRTVNVSSRCAYGFNPGVAVRSLPSRLRPRRRAVFVTVSAKYLGSSLLAASNTASRRVRVGR